MNMSPVIIVFQNSGKNSGSFSRDNEMFVSIVTMTLGVVMSARTS